MSAREQVGWLAGHWVMKPIQNNKNSLKAWAWADWFEIQIWGCLSDSIATTLVKFNKRMGIKVNFSLLRKIFAHCLSYASACECYKTAQVVIISGIEGQLTLILFLGAWSSICVSWYRSGEKEIKDCEIYRSLTNVTMAGCSLIWRLQNGGSSFDTKGMFGVFESKKMC
jgi:hypothetical protein